jgi:putative spermidine/putrescine transport system ATP-binding protein
MAEVTLDSITKQYDDAQAIGDVSLTVNDGEILGIVGPSGCGKTTTLRTIAGFERPTAGSVRFDGEDVTDVDPVNRNVGLLFQSYALFNNMSVIENVTFGPRMQGVPKRERMSRARELLRMLEIEELEDRNPRQLSGGQQQRVGLARALAPEPRILLLDEPMTGLDAKLKRQLRPEIGRLLDELEVTVLYVTHDQEEAMAMCDRIAVMNDGTVEQVGAPSEVYEKPASRFVANFVGTTNILTGRVEDGAVDLGFASVPLADESGLTGDVTVVARPEAFTFTDSQVDITVRDTFYLGEQLEVIADLPDGREITLKPQNNVSVTVGETTMIGVDTSRLHLIADD